MSISHAHAGAMEDPVGTNAPQTDAQTGGFGSLESDSSALSDEVEKETNFSGTIVVKIGGSTLGSHDTTLHDLVTLQRQGINSIVVHGGGKIISDWMAKQGVMPRFVQAFASPTSQVLTSWSLSSRASLTRTLLLPCSSWAPDPLA